MVPTADDLRRLLDFFQAEYCDETGGWVAPCPVCGDDDARGNHLRVNPGDARLCVCHCFHCADGPLRGRDWWREVVRRLKPDASLTAAMAAAVTPEQCRRLWAELEGRPAAGPTAAPVGVRDRVYRVLFDRLELSAAHRQWLSGRGADPDRAFAAGYRSTPPAGKRDLARDLRRQFGDTLFAVPGLASGDDGEARLLTPPGAVLIPSRDSAGRVRGLKLRLVGAGDGPRMYWLSSARAGGPGAANDAHCPLGAGGRRWPRVWLTEGERKADVYWWRTGLPTVGVAGVNAWGRVLPLLAEVAEAGGEVVVALDRDGAGRRGEGAVCAGLAAAGYRVFVADWDGAKGLDDAVVTGREVRTRSWEAPPPVTAPPERTSAAG